VLPFGGLDSANQALVPPIKRQTIAIFNKITK